MEGLVRPNVLVDFVLGLECCRAFFGRAKTATAGQFNAQSAPIGDVDGAFVFMGVQLAAGRQDLDPPRCPWQATVATAGRVGTTVKGGCRAVKTQGIPGANHNALAQAATPLPGTSRVLQIRFFPEDQR